MIITETEPGFYGTARYFELSEIEQNRVYELLNELKEIFNAEGVGFIPEMTMKPKTDYTIKIYNGDNIGYRFPH